VDTYVSICLTTARGGGTQGHRRTETARDPGPGPRGRAQRRRDRVALRGHAAGGLPAPERPEGGGARERATQRHPTPLPGPSRGAPRAAGLPERILGRPARSTQTRSREGGTEDG